MKSLFVIFCNWIGNVASAVSVKLAVKIVMTGCAVVFGWFMFRKRRRAQLVVAITRANSYPISIALQLLQEKPCTGVWIEYELLRLEQIIQRDLDPAVVSMVKEINSDREVIRQLFGDECIAKIDLCIGCFDQMVNWRYLQTTYDKMRACGLRVLQAWSNVIESMKLGKKDKRRINNIMKDSCNARGVEWLSDFNKMLS